MPIHLNFSKNIRSSNSAFAFVSIGANIKIPQGSGPFCYRIHGQMYHISGTLHPDKNHSRQYAQLYIFDEDVANNERINEPANKTCYLRLMEKISDVMKSNPFACAFKMMYGVEEAQKYLKPNIETQIVMEIVQNRKTDPR
ncbi:hypothetical protein CWI38_0403p0030 [Hamiltosporidium tvaerminnensis]|uniref:Helitron helicase-like domain-containing protein n=2 Tax=Hamiltosporidium TaxID=1176354 RepID=A0A4Q9LRH1_9MICR|nr:hypothetical protein CWI39_0001p0080 [Hamiltosporidium magnivora]TBU13531.1 hypothetical protein CWI38_0403p0030 [Hamiltosporidium tvaerminnensis]